MPEGPEIRRTALDIGQALVGHKVEVQFDYAKIKAWEDSLNGQAVTQVTSHGKALLIRFANDLTLYSHNQLYGVWYVRKSGSWPKTNRQLRVRLDTGSKMALLYSASEIQVLTPAQVATHPFLSRLGPDMLDPLTLAEVIQRYKDKRFCKRRITSLLLDQGFLAGMGNYLRSEIMHVAGIPPAARPCDLTPKQLKRLAEASLELPRRSLETRGILNPPERAAELKARGLSRSQYRFAAFTREGQHCYACGGEILKTQAATRRLYYCPGCQK